MLTLKLGTNIHLSRLFTGSYRIFSKEVKNPFIQEAFPHLHLTILQDPIIDFT